MDSRRLIWNVLIPILLAAGCSGRGANSSKALPSAPVTLWSKEQLLEDFSRRDPRYIARSIANADPENIGDGIKLASVFYNLEFERTDPSLMLASTDVSARTRAMAGRILGMIDPSDHRGTMLLALVRDKDQLVRRMSIPALSTYWKYPQIRTELRRIGTRGNYIDGPLANLVGAQQGDELALNRLIESAFRSGKSEYRVIVVQMLGTLKKRAAARAALEKLKSDKDSRVSAAAAAELDS